MFRKIGLKIKRLAVFFTIIGMIISTGLGVFVAIAGKELAYYYLSVPVGSADSICIIAGIVIIIVGSLFSWLGSFMLYGYGELIDQTQKQRELLSEIYNKQLGGATRYEVPNKATVPPPVQYVNTPQPNVPHPSAPQPNIPPTK